MPQTKIHGAQIGYELRGTGAEAFLERRNK